MHNSRGSVLIFVLILMAFILYLGSMQARHSVIEAQIAGNYRRNAQAYYLAEAGVEGALAVLQSNLSLVQNGGFVLEGTAPGGFFEVSLMDSSSTLISRGFAGNAKETIRVEVNFSEFPAENMLVVPELMLSGNARIEGGLHVNAALNVSHAGNSVDGPFSFSGGDPVFDEGASLFLEALQVTATKVLDLNPYRVASARPVFNFNEDFYRGKGYQAFATLEEYLLAEGLAGQPLKKIRITNHLDLSALSGNFPFHGVVVVTSPQPVILSGFINTEAADQGNQMVILATEAQDIIICPTPDGHLQLGGTFFLLTKGNISLQGAPGFGGETLRFQGAVVCHRLALRDTTFVYDTLLEADIFREVKDLPLMEARWLKIH
jgi:hypothetical protein